MSDVLTREYIDQICKQLDCSQQVVAHLLGVTPQTISNNVRKPLSSVKPKKRKRIELLYYVVVKHLATVRSDAIYQIINAQVYEDIRGHMHSVVTAILEGKWDLEMVRHIADIAWDAYRREELKNSLETSYESQLSEESRAVA